MFFDNDDSFRIVFFGLGRIYRESLYIKNNFSDAKIIEEQQNILKYRIGETSPVKISEVLQVLQSVKNENLARDYSVTQATLDDVFIQFAREKDEEEKCREKAQKAIEEVEAITV